MKSWLKAGLTWFFLPVLVLVITQIQNASAVGPPLLVDWKNGGSFTGTQFAHSEGIFKWRTTVIDYKWWDITTWTNVSPPGKVVMFLVNFTFLSLPGFFAWLLFEFIEEETDEHRTHPDNSDRIQRRSGSRDMVLRTQIPGKSDQESDRKQVPTRLPVSNLH
jgi:hypothetical protein